jgi:hypothetical protein
MMRFESSFRRLRADLPERIRGGIWTKNKLVVAAVGLTTAMSMLVAEIAFPRQTLANNDNTRTIIVDVALGYPYFQNNVKPKEAPPAFFPGDTFIQDGNVYRPYTIPSGKTQFDPKTPGIGKYRSRGTFTTDLDSFIRASEHRGGDPDLAFATEMFTLQAENSMLMTEGTWPNAYLSTKRVVLGGTGIFRNVIGEAHIENIGENKEGFCNFRVTFRLRQVD